MDIILYIILAGLIVGLAVATVKFFKRNRIVWPRKTEIPEPHFRVLIGLRRRAAGVGQIVGMSEEAHGEIRKTVTTQWQALCQKWSQIGTLQGGFRKSEQGLPAGGDEDWFLIAFLDIVDYNAFRQCISIIDNKDFRDLRNFCDIRLILGDIVGPDGSDIREFF
jgi:hypothetical protein